MELSNSFVSKQQLSFLLGIIILRMVNGITDQFQGEYVESVYSIAQNISLPRSLVDIRHSVAHNVFPSLPTLEIGKEQVTYLLSDPIYFNNWLSIQCSLWLGFLSLLKVSLCECFIKNIRR